MLNSFEHEIYHKDKEALFNVAYLKQTLAV